VAELPDYLTHEHNRDPRDRFEVLARRSYFALLLLLVVVALANVFGQKVATSRTAGDRAELTVEAPAAVRGGLFYQGEFTIRARRELRNATLVLDRGWLDGMHINTIAPAPVGEASRNGRLALDFGHVAAGDFVVARLQFQVNPTTVGVRPQDVALYDDTELVARVDRTVRIFP